MNKDLDLLNQSIADAVSAISALDDIIAKGDVVGHPFHGNQYKQGQSDARRASEPASHRAAQKHHERASAAHDKARTKHDRKANNFFDKAETARSKAYQTDNPDKIRQHMEMALSHSAASAAHDEAASAHAAASLAHDEAAQVHHLGHSRDFADMRPSRDEARRVSDMADTATLRATDMTNNAWANE